MTVSPVGPAPNDAFVVALDGRLNMAVTPVIRQELTDLISDGKTRLVVDLADVETVDSSVIGALIGVLKLARQAGGDLRIVAPSIQVAEVLKMTNLTRVLPTYPSVEHAFDR